jgi:hypothetical protein
MKSDTLVIILFLAAGGTIMYLLLKKPTATLTIPGGAGAAAGYNPGNTAVTTLFAGLGATIGGALRSAFSSSHENTNNPSKEAALDNNDASYFRTASLGDYSLPDPTAGLALSTPVTLDTPAPSTSLADPSSSFGADVGFHPSTVSL